MREIVDLKISDSERVTAFSGIETLEKNDLALIVTWLRDQIMNFEGHLGYAGRITIGIEYEANKIEKTITADDIILSTKAKYTEKI